MNEQKPSNNGETPSVVQDIILSGKIGIISAAIAKRLNISPVQALEMFYGSETCRRLHNPDTGLYLYGDQYIVDEFFIEQQGESK